MVIVKSLRSGVDTCKLNPCGYHSLESHQGGNQIAPFFVAQCGQEESIDELHITLLLPRPDSTLRLLLVYISVILTGLHSPTSGTMPLSQLVGKHPTLRIAQPVNLRRLAAFAVAILNA